MKCPMNSDEKKSAHPARNNRNGNMTGDVDFSEFVWMGEENLEEFDRKVELELWEEQFIESCFNEMWRAEEQDTVYFAGNASEGSGNVPSTYNAYPAFEAPPQPLYQRGQGQGQGQGQGDLANIMAELSVQERNGINQARSSKLNPNAEVFIPRITPAPSNGASQASNVER